jgi:hypothetical protein
MRCIIEGVRYLNINPFGSELSHPASGNAQPVGVRHAGYQITSLAVDDRIEARVNANRRVASNNTHFVEHLLRENLLEQRESPVDGHCPLIAAIVHSLLPFKDGIFDAGLRVGDSAWSM